MLLMKRTKMRARAKCVSMYNWNPVSRCQNIAIYNTAGVEWARKRIRKKAITLNFFSMYKIKSLKRGFKILFLAVCINVFFSLNIIQLFVCVISIQFQCAKVVVSQTYLFHIIFFINSVPFIARILFTLSLTINF